MKVLRYVVLGVLAYLVFLTATVPAALAYPYLKQQLAPLQLYGIEGSIWAGTADTADLGTYRLGTLNWRVHPWMLLLGRVELAWSHGPGQGSGIVTRKLNGDLQARAVNLKLPVSSLAQLIPNLPFKLDGMVLATLSELSVAKPGEAGLKLLSAQGVINWNEAALLVPQALPLGGFALQLSTDNGVIKGVLSDKGGALQAQGSLLLKPDQSYQFNGSLGQKAGANNPQLQQMLAFAGPLGADGKVTISVSGALPGKAKPALPVPLPSTPPAPATAL